MGKIKSRFKIQDSRFKVKRIGGLRSEFTQSIGVGLGILTLLMNFGCTNQSLLKKNNNVAAVVQENNVSEYERDLQTMKTANFDYIFAFRRKDAGVFDAEDRKYLRANTPPGTNRFVLTDQERAFIAGSRYKFSPENLEALQNRFTVENYSKPEDQITPQNTNQTTNQKTNVNR